MVKNGIGFVLYTSKKYWRSTEQFFGPPYHQTFHHRIWPHNHCHHKLITFHPIVGLNSKQFINALGEMTAIQPITSQQMTTTPNNMTWHGMQRGNHAQWPTPHHVTNPPLQRNTKENICQKFHLAWKVAQILTSIAFFLSRNNHNKKDMHKLSKKKF